MKFHSTKWICSNFPDGIIKIGFILDNQKADKIYEMMGFKTLDIRWWMTVVLWASKSIITQSSCLESFWAMVTGRPLAEPDELGLRRQSWEPRKSQWVELTGQNIGRSELQRENSGVSKASASWMQLDTDWHMHFRTHPPLPPSLLP